MLLFSRPDISFYSLRSNLRFSFWIHVESSVITEVLINIQADRKQLNLLLSFVLREVFVVNAHSSLKIRDKWLLMQM